MVVRRTGSGDQVQAILKDSLGSTVATVSSVANRRSYDAFGAARNADYSPRPNGTLNLPATIHGFTGHTHADAVALIHMGGRIYDPNLGRFLSSDPIIQNLANGQSINPYSYVLNNPFSGRDPTGYAIQCNDNKTCGMSDAPTQDDQQWKKSGPLLPKGNGADGLTAKGPQSQPVDGSAADIGTPSRTINGLSVSQLDKVTVRPGQDWVASRDVTWNIYGAERAEWAHRLAQQSGYDMIRGFYGFQWDLWSSQFTGDVPVVGVVGAAGGLIRGVSTVEDMASVAKGAPLLLNGPIRLTEAGMAHAVERHTANEIARFAGKSKFNEGENLAELILSGTQQRMVQQANGNFARTWDVGRPIGIDRATGQQTQIMTVITRPSGELVTAFPGFP